MGAKIGYALPIPLENSPFVSLPRRERSIRWHNGTRIRKNCDFPVLAHTEKRKLPNCPPDGVMFEHSRGKAAHSGVCDPRCFIFES